MIELIRYDSEVCAVREREREILFNGRRPVPITRVLNIPCWDKSRQVVKPGFQIYIYNLGPQRISIAALGGQ